MPLFDYSSVVDRNQFSIPCKRVHSQTIAWTDGVYGKTIHIHNAHTYPGAVCATNICRSCPLSHCTLVSSFFFVFQFILQNTLPILQSIVELPNASCTSDVGHGHDFRWVHCTPVCHNSMPQIDLQKNTHTYFAEYFETPTNPPDLPHIIYNACILDLNMHKIYKSI